MVVLDLGGDDLMDCTKEPSIGIKPVSKGVRECYDKLPIVNYWQNVTYCVAAFAILLPLHQEQKPRFFHEKIVIFSSLQSWHFRRRTPWAIMPYFR